MSEASPVNLLLLYAVQNRLIFSLAYNTASLSAFNTVRDTLKQRITGQRQDAPRHHFQYEYFALGNVEHVQRQMGGK